MYDEILVKNKKMFKRAIYDVFEARLSKAVILKSAVLELYYVVTMVVLMPCLLSPVTTCRLRSSLLNVLHVPFCTRYNLNFKTNLYQ